MSIISVMLAFLAPMMRAKPDDESERLRELEIENKALRDRINDLSRINSALVRCESGQIAGLQAQLKTATQRVTDYRLRLLEMEAMCLPNADMPQRAAQQPPSRVQMTDNLRPLEMFEAMAELQAVRSFCKCTPSRSEMLVRTQGGLYPHAIRREDSLGLDPLTGWP